MYRAIYNPSRERYSSARREIHPPAACASCGSTVELVPYGAALFCAECRDQAEPFTGKDLYCDLGGGD